MSYNGKSDYAPPPGPPPGRQSHGDYAPPPGPPPGRQEQYAPPAGPPPGHASQTDYAPPPGPPPSHDWAKPPSDPQPTASSKHDWEAAVPDTSLFPPPPPLFNGHYMSPTSNADEEQAKAGVKWCDENPLSQPITLDQAGLNALHSYNVRLMEPAGFNGRLNWLGPGVWEASTAKGTPDRCIISYPPLYSVNQHDPTKFGRPRTIYYEFRLRPDSRTNNLAVGFTALPYPSFRMPGWHRGSLAVHGDDGHKYINDMWGGKDFTQSFNKGEVYGIGMKLSPTGTHKPHVRIFFTRSGAMVGGWDLDEERDAEEDGPVTGLEGFHDLCCAIGTYDGVSFEVYFEPSRWLFRPEGI